MDAVLALPARFATHLENARVRLICSIILGGCGALAFAPFFFWPALACFSGLLYLVLRAESGKEAFWISSTFAFTYYVANLYWVGNAFVTVGLGPVSLVAYIGLPLLLSFDIVTCATLMWRWTRHMPPVFNALFFAASMAISSVIGSFSSELAFPWVEFGYAMPFTPLQGASILGVEGLSTLIVFAMLIPFARSRNYTVLFGLPIIALYAYGLMQLQHPTEETLYNFRLIQPSVPQEAKWDPAEVNRNLQLQGMLSQMDGEKPIQAVIWPEASIPFDYKKYPDVQQNLSFTAPNGGYVFLGHPRNEGDRIYNSFTVLSDKNEIVATYDKKHLVPFGEFVPFRKLLPGVQKLTHGARDFSRGSQPSIIKLSNVPDFRVLVCYEVLFPREILQNDDKRPEWILNITNDAWYGNTTGPHQHLHISRVRAIEQGLPLIRVANNGISAIIDAYGRIIHKLGLNDVGFIDFALPKANAKTFYNKYGYFVSFVILIICSLILGGLFWLNHKKKYTPLTPTSAKD